MRFRFYMYSVRCSKRAKQIPDDFVNLLTHTHISGSLYIELPVEIRLVASGVTVCGGC